MVFNKHNAKFSGIIGIAAGAFEVHSQFNRAHAAKGTGEWQFDMTSCEDEGLQVRAMYLRLISSWCSRQAAR